MRNKSACLALAALILFFASSSQASYFHPDGICAGLFWIPSNVRDLRQQVQRDALVQEVERQARERKPSVIIEESQRRFLNSLDAETSYALHALLGPRISDWPVILGQSAHGAFVTLRWDWYHRVLRVGTLKPLSLTAEQYQALRENEIGRQGEPFSAWLKRTEMSFDLARGSYRRMGKFVLTEDVFNANPAAAIDHFPAYGTWSDAKKSPWLFRHTAVYTVSADKKSIVPASTQEVADFVQIVMKVK